MGPRLADGVQGVVVEVKVEPAGQLAQLAAPESAKVEPVQAVHEVEPGAYWDVPAGQGVQAVLPALALKVPAGHCVQVAAVALIWAAGPKEPAAQGVPVHTLAPTPAAYVPEAHGEQVALPVVAPLT